VSRVVMFVFNDCSTDTRVLREAATLQAAGHTVTIMARPRDVLATEGNRETLESGVELIRVPVPQKWRVWFIMARYPWRQWWRIRLRIIRNLRRPPMGWIEIPFVGLFALLLAPWVALAGGSYLVMRALGRGHLKGGYVFNLFVRWRFSIIGWGKAAAHAAPEADIYHGHDLTGIPGAVEGRRRTGGIVVYDSHEVFLESGMYAKLPGRVRRVLGRLERGCTREAAAMVTVNRGLEDELTRRYRPNRVVIVYNCPPRWTPPDPRPDHLRRAAGIPPAAPVVLYHGGFTPDRGLLPLARAMLEPGMEGAHLVLLGFGPMRERLEQEAADPGYGGRVHVVPGVRPDVLNEWVASADVGAMPNQPANMNERLSTPNKLFESLAAGIPVVLSDFPERHRIVMDDPDGPLGAVCDPTKPADIARALRSIIELPLDEREALKRRCLKAAHERWNWETEGAKLVELYEDLETQLVRARSSVARADYGIPAPGRPAAVSVTAPVAEPIAAHHAAVAARALGPAAIRTHAAAPADPHEETESEAVEPAGRGARSGT
jgi:glycosyltransferase involved in cell wall biosynthesis